MRNAAKVGLLISILFSGCSSETATRTFKCEVGNGADGRVVDVTGNEHPIYKAPDLKSDRIVNNKASSATGNTEYHSLWSSQKVEVQCEHGDWARIQVVEPDWLHFVKGWVETKYLLQTSQSGENRVFTEEDIYWDINTKDYKEGILKELNRIHKENPICTNAMDTGTVTKSPTKSTPGNPVFFVTCGSGVNAKNVWFTSN
jgi:hypothetical protein